MKAKNEVKEKEKQIKTTSIEDLAATKIQQGFTEMKSRNTLGKVKESNPRLLSQDSVLEDHGKTKNKVFDGVLTITVHEAKNLLDKDFAGKSDPYVLISYGEKMSKSKPIESTLNPTFNFTGEFQTEKDGPSELIVEVVDDDLGKDESLGLAIIDILKADQSAKFWVNLKGVKSGRILLSLNVKPSRSPDDLRVHSAATTIQVG